MEDTTSQLNFSDMTDGRHGVATISLFSGGMVRFTNGCFYNVVDLKDIDTTLTKGDIVYVTTNKRKNEAREILTMVRLKD